MGVPIKNYNMKKVDAEIDNFCQDITPVKEGGTKITDFEDLKIAFLELNEKHNKLAIDYTKLKSSIRNQMLIANI
jgi:hypothetical protein